MNAFKLKTLWILALGCMLATGPVSAALLVGDTVVINFTESANTVGGNWNDYVATLDSSITDPAPLTLISDLIRLSDGDNTGVGLQIDNFTGENFGLGGRNEAPDASRAFPVSGAIPDAAQRRLTFHTEAGQQYIFTGLDDNLIYNLSILSANTAGRNAHAWVANPGVNQTSILVDPDDGLVHTFFNLSTNGSGSIILQSTTTGSGVNAQHINAMELTAIPEPGTLVLIGIALGSMLLFRRRD
ncbi:MAG: PEP-CTERM sorting domain-containing protein [Verrucomicrobia bacterium]|nr:PEP-CTERM sorting domain-containing protein [Verrucomicrobiota bacterium]